MKIVLTGLVLGFLAFATISPNPIWLDIAVGLLVMAICFSIGFAFGYRTGYREGDYVWRRQVVSKKGVVGIDATGALFNLSDSEREAMERAIQDFEKGKPAKVKGIRHGPR